jgi:hypothetical protein
MCLAIAKPARAVIPLEHLEAGYEGNPHGCGFCYPEGGRVVVVKGLFTFPEFLTKYREKEHLPMLVHFRVSTHGKASFLNCHPFSFFDGRFALIHNGVISISLSYPELSDTGNFAKLVMEPMVKNAVDPDKPAFRFLVQQAIGSHNKVCVMDATGRIIIYNENSGESEEALDKDGNPVIETDSNGKQYQEEVWYSHGGYKFNKRRRSQNYNDEYEGLFNCGQGEEVVPLTGEDMTTSVGEGFSGTPVAGVNPAFTHRAKLTPPQGIIEGFKPGTLSKDAGKSAQAIAEAYGGVISTEKEGKLVHIKLPSKPDAKSRIITEITSGPIYDARTELEMAHLQEKMGLTRDECIKYLGLKIEDCISYVEV